MSTDAGVSGPRLAADRGSPDRVARTHGRARPALPSAPAPKWRPEAWFAEVMKDAGLTHAEDAGPPWVDTRTIKVLRDKRRPLVSGDLLETDGTRRTVVAKAYHDNRGARTLRLLHLLSDAGLRTGRFTVTAGLGWSRDRRALVTEEAPGLAWSELLLNPVHELAQASAAVAAWLATLQSLPLGSGPEPGLPNHSIDRARSDTHAQVEELGEHFPRAHRRLALLSQQALVDLTAAADEPLVPSHGDLHPHNIRVHRDGTDLLVTALDLDRVGWRRRSYDVGHAVAQLLIMSVMRCRSFVPGALAAQAFLIWLSGEASSALHAAVGAEVTRALLRSLHHEFVNPANEPLDLLPAWCAVAEAILSDGVAEVLPRLAGGWRP